MKLDDLIRETKNAKTPEPNWKSIDEKLFARIEQEPRVEERDEPREHVQGGRVVWIGAALSLAAAAAALLVVHPAQDGASIEHATAQSAGAVVAGDVTVGGAFAKNLAGGDRVDIGEHVAYFESKNSSGETAVRWSSQSGSILHVEHAASPLVLSLEKGVAEAQVTPVPSGEAFAIDVTSSSGNVVRVAVHGTHLRVAREGDKVIVDLTEGVVSIGAPPRRGSTIGTLVTAPAHVELDARDLASVHVDHEASAIRAADYVTPQPQMIEPTQVNPETASLTLTAPTRSETTREVLRTQTSNAKPTTNNGNNIVEPAPTMFTTQADLANAIATCGRDGVAPQTTFTTTLTLNMNDDGSVQNARFQPPLLPEARDCAATVIYKRTKLGATGHVDVPITISR